MTPVDSAPPPGDPEGLPDAPTDGDLPDAATDGDLPGDDLPGAAAVETIDGFTLDDLADYLERGRSPRDPRIEGSADCRLALQALERLAPLSRASLEQEAEREPDRDEAWIAGLLETIRGEVVGGRDIPVGHPDPRTVLSVTEAAARGLVRRAGDALDGVILTSTTFDGDVDVPGAPVVVRVTIAARYGLDLQRLADRLRRQVVAALATHTRLAVTAVDVTVDDVWLASDVDHDLEGGAR